MYVFPRVVGIDPTLRWNEDTTDKGTRPLFLRSTPCRQTLRLWKSSGEHSLGRK